MNPKLNLVLQQLLLHIESRPAPPQRTASKETFAKFAKEYSKWLIMLDTLTADAKGANKHYSQMSREEAEDAVREAESVLRAEYFSDIRAITEDIKSELTAKLEAGDDGEPLREWLTEYIDQTIDGHHNVIYTAAAQKVVLFSDNSGAYVENYGEEGLAEGGDICWSRLAWAAMREDVIEQLDAEGIDVNEPDGDETKDALGVGDDTEDE